MVKIKKILKVIIILIIILNTNIPIQYADDTEDEDFNEKELSEIIESSTQANEEPTINSKAAIIYDRTTKKVIWGKEENTKRAMASTTKIMTAIIVLENANLDEIATVSKKAANTGGSRLKLNTGDKVSINDLLYGLMLRSRK